MTEEEQATPPFPEEVLAPEKVRRDLTEEDIDILRAIWEAIYERARAQHAVLVATKKRADLTRQFIDTVRDKRAASHPIIFQLEIDQNAWHRWSKAATADDYVESFMENWPHI